MPKRKYLNVYATDYCTNFGMQMGSIYCEVKTMNGKGVKTMGMGKNKCQCTVFNNVTDRPQFESVHWTPVWTPAETFSTQQIRNSF